ncbi:hypothetical protein IJG04_02955 [Candidatus Saccharibacteria bacterium]|nr:hypothetical protein [Candidatus Saccharibacteria bacterium]
MQNSTNKKQKLIAIIGALLVILILTIITAVSIISSNNNSTESLEITFADDGYPDEDGDKTPYLYIDNPTYLESILGETIFSNMQTYLQFLASTKETSSAPHENTPSEGVPTYAYDATINNSSVNSDIYFPYSTYSFEFNISDGRTYQAHLATSGEMYFALIINRTTPTSSEPPHFYIDFLETELDNNYNREETISNLTNWAKSLGFNELILTTNN